ncbi:MAG TPA: homocysteine S-methyltransferase family protein [Anaerohalosphaeraceae bacterium]|nr:homocysteine S-methyltransferase family protein [Anaerohalosphaeraceae bacterium]
MAQRLREGLFFLDGAMGTQLFARGVRQGQCVERLNVEQPQIVAEVHRAYLEAGCDAVLTNTFGGNSLSLRRHRVDARTEKLNEAGARLARREAGPDRYVLGDIGPCGDFLEPIGTLKTEDLKAAFVRQVRGLLDGGVDGFLIETMTALEEIEVVIEAVRSICADLPILVSLAFDPAKESFRTMMGVSPQQAVGRLAGLGISAVGFNCGTLDMDSYVRLAQEFAGALSGKGLLLLAEPNAGKPRLEGERAVYDLAPEEFARGLERIHQAGAVIVGGCCGTSPEHLAAAVKHLRR